MSEQPAEYRTPGHHSLTAVEVELIQRIKAKEAEMLELVTEAHRITLCVPDRAPEGHRWASIAKTHFQEGTMALVRAITRPDLA